MECQIVLIDPINDIKWEELLPKDNYKYFFYNSNWANTLINCYNFKPYYLIIKKEKNIQAIAPLLEINSFITGKRAVSLPFTDYCEPFLVSKDFSSDFWDILIKYGKEKKWKYIELRGGENYFDLNKSYLYYLEHYLDLSKTIDVIYSGFKDSCKRNIKKAKQSGIIIKTSIKYEDLKKFYNLNLITRKKHGIPPQPFSFFKSIHENIFKNNKGIIFLAEFENKCIASYVFFYDEFLKTAIYKFGASDPKYLYTRANNLIIWEAIQFFKSKNFKHFLFGRTSIDNDGLIQFKNNWTEDIKKIYYFKYDLKKDKFLKSEAKDFHFYNKIFNKFPIFLLKFIGEKLYKHIA